MGSEVPIIGSKWGLSYPWGRLGSCSAANPGHPHLRPAVLEAANQADF